MISTLQHSVQHSSPLTSTNLHFHFVVTMQAQMETPPDMQCKDKFLIQNVVAKMGATKKDITSEMVTSLTKKFIYKD